MITKTVEDIPMRLNPADGGISGELNSRGGREKAFMYLLRQEICGPLALDIGANIGYTTLNMLKHDDEVKVMAFEPDPRSLDLLYQNIELNRMEDRIEIFDSALSNEIGNKSINLSTKPNLTSFCETKSISGTRDVSIDTIDNLFKDKDILPSFIKMDVEGYEVEILQGGMETFKRADKVKILLETHQQNYSPERNFENVLREMVAIGFKFKFIVSAACVVPDKMKEKGYSPCKTFENFGRAIYNDIETEDAIIFSSQVIEQIMPHKNNRISPKIVRSILLEKSK